MFVRLLGCVFVCLFICSFVKLCICLFVCQAWPEDALEMVANKFLEEVDMALDERKMCVFMCKYFHESVRQLSERYATPLFF